jgi:hypothetical protein
MHITPRTVARLAAASLLAAVAAGCGSSSETSTQGPSAVDWANGLCSAVTSYKSSLGDVGKSLKSTPSRSTLEQAAQDTKTATQTLVASVKDLGKPGTAAGDQAKQTLDGLASDLHKDASTIQGATGGDAAVLNSVSVVSTTLVTAQSQLKTALDELQQLAPKDELKQAFSQASSCSPYSVG